MKCENCSYYWQECEYEEEKQEYVPLEPRPSCHFDADNRFPGELAPCEEEDEIADRWECESSRDDWDMDEDYSWQQF